MLALIGVDAMPEGLVAELEAQGRMPRLAELRRAGTTVQLATPATHFPAGAFSTLWSGVPIAEHGIHYPFIWDARSQRVRYLTDFPMPPSVWERVSGAGGTVLVVDPYEGTIPAVPVRGLVVSGWQFGNRVVLRPWSTPSSAYRTWGRRFGRGPRAEEVFGEPDERTLRRLAATLVQAPARAADLVVAALPAVRPDLLVVGLPAVHLAGHQLFDPGSVVRDITPASAAELRRALESTIVETDTALGRIVDALPAGADVIVVSSLGMAAETSRTDVLGTMLAAVLDGARLDGAPPAGSWRLRASVPASLRAAFARALPDAVATGLAARLELRGVDWSRTRAFPVPSDTMGMVRFGLRGRERAGIVDPAGAPALAEEIGAGLQSFAFADGEPVVAAVETLADAFGQGASDLLPDLVVRWTDRPARRGEMLRSPRFGTICRHGVGSGRSGNHTATAWALVLSANGRRTPEGARDLIDVPAAVLARFGLEHRGRPLLAAPEAGPQRAR